MDNPHFNEDRLKEIFEAVHDARKLGILTDDTTVNENFKIENPVKIKENNLDTTTSSLLLGGRAPRIDSLVKLRKIARLLQIQSEFYPNFKPRHLEKFIRIVIGNADSRTVQRYLKCITGLSQKHKVYGLYDVSGFCIQALT